VIPRYYHFYDRIIKTSETRDLDEIDRKRTKQKAQERGGESTTYSKNQHRNESHRESRFEAISA
jgi:hypothetical protein